MIKIRLPFVCPRRYDFQDPGKDKIGIDYWRENNTCSCCGSLHPDQVFNELKDGVKAVPTDKGYKMYVGDRKVYFQHFTEDQRKTFVDMLNDSSIKIDSPGYFYVLPFFIEKPEPETHTGKISDV